MRNLILSVILGAGAYASPFTATYYGETFGHMSITNGSLSRQNFSWAYGIEVTYLDGRENPGPHPCCTPGLMGFANLPVGTVTTFSIGGIEPGFYRMDITYLRIFVAYEGQTLVAEFLPTNGYVLFNPPQTVQFVPQQLAPLTAEVPEPLSCGFVGLGLLTISLIGRHKWKSSY